MRQFYVKRKRPKRYIDYFDYINGSLWTYRKALYFEKHKRECRACGTKWNIQLHHLKYGNFGREKDRDLIVLCEPCHREFHLKFNNRNLHEDTIYFIENKQAKIKQQMIERLKEKWLNVQNPQQETQKLLTASQ